MTTSENEWQRAVQRVTMSGTASGSKWQPVTTNDNAWQPMAASGTANENNTVHFHEWMAFILFVTEADTLLQGLDDCN